MRIWLINHYAVPIKYYPLARTTNFAKYLGRMGHEVIIFAASSVHNNASVNLAHKNELYHTEFVDGIDYVLVRCCSYEGNGKDRIWNMFEFPRRLKKVCSHFKRPDVVMASSATPLACMMGLRIAKKNGAKAVAEITDLWPESFVAYGLLGKRNLLLPFMYTYEKRMYEYADMIIFSMEGAADYIRDRHWEKDVPKTKIAHINNGIDLEAFNYNRENFKLQDDDLENNEIIKVVYVGSIRKVNQLGYLLDIAKEIKNSRVKFLVWGTGDEFVKLQKRIEAENVSNFVLKGRVDKQYIPYIISQADINIVHNSNAPIFRYGISANKLFDNLAAGKPILVDFESRYNPVAQGKAGLVVGGSQIDEVARTMEEFFTMPRETYEEYCKNAVITAKQYDFAVLTEKLADIFEEITHLHG